MKNINKKILKNRLINKDITKKISYLFAIILLYNSQIMADELATKVQGFINGPVMLWLKIIGALVIIGGVIGMAVNRQDSDRIRGLWYVIFTGIALFSVPTIINILMSTFSGSTVNFN